MTRRTKKIEKVVSLATSEERRFGEQAGRSQQSLNAQLNRLGELNAYRHSYSKKQPLVSGASAAHWKDYQSFLQRLDHAVQSQNQIIRECEQNVAIHRERWMVKRQKLESLERVFDKSKQRDAVYQARLEQKQMDDLPVNTDSIMKPDPS